MSSPHHAVKTAGRGRQSLSRGGRALCGGGLRGRGGGGPLPPSGLLGPATAPGAPRPLALGGTEGGVVSPFASAVTQPESRASWACAEVTVGTRVLSLVSRERGGCAPPADRLQPGPGESREPRQAAVCWWLSSPRRDKSQCEHGRHTCVSTGSTSLPGRRFSAPRRAAGEGAVFPVQAWVTGRGRHVTRVCTHAVCARLCQKG